jgi:hypothetical protein
MTWNDDDGIGYGRTPKWTRFQKGQSGNPNGRPKKDNAKDKETPAKSEYDDLLRAALNRKVEITEGGKRRMVTVAEIVQQMQIAAASKGNVIAQRDVLQALRMLEERDRERAKAEEEMREKVFAYMVSKRAQQARLWREAEARGVEPEQPWPHPDDILINEATSSWRIRGPGSPQDVLFFEGIRADRDVLLMRSYIDVKRGRRRQAFAAYWGFMALAMDDMLPLRWQVGDDGWDSMGETFVPLPMTFLRALLAEFERRAKAIKRPVLSKEEQKAVYQVTNRVMQPLLRPMGYRSFRQFELAYAEMGDKMPWPRQSKSAGP